MTQKMDLITEKSKTPVSGVIFYLTYGSTSYTPTYIHAHIFDFDLNCFVTNKNRNGIHCGDL